MHRSSSTSPISDEFFIHQSSSSPSQILKSSSEADQLHLPTYDPLSQPAMRERSRLRSAENVIHLIPLVLILCAIVLWFFSHPASRV